MSVERGRRACPPSCGTPRHTSSPPPLASLVPPSQTRRATAPGPAPGPVTQGASRACAQPALLHRRLLRSSLRSPLPARGSPLRFVFSYYGARPAAAAGCTHAWPVVVSPRVKSEPPSKTLRVQKPGARLVGRERLLPPPPRIARSRRARLARSAHHNKQHLPRPHATSHDRRASRARSNISSASRNISSASRDSPGVERPREAQRGRREGLVRFPGGEDLRPLAKLISPLSLHCAPLFATRLPCPPDRLPCASPVPPLPPARGPL